MNIALGVVVVLESAGLIALGVLLIVTRRRLAGARKQLQRRHREDGGQLRQSRRKPAGVAAVAPLAVKTVTQTLKNADSLIRHGIVAPMRSSVDELAAWARVEKPDLARITSDGRVVLVFSDIEGSTERNESLGDDAWVKVLERHNELIKKKVAEHHGYVVKNQGDGFMIAFADPDDAVRCSIAVQQALTADPDRYSGVRVRIGAHAGSSVRRGDDLFGRNVAMAARIADQAGGGEILVSGELRESLTDPGIRLASPVELELKGLRGAQTVYGVEVRHE